MGLHICAVQESLFDSRDASREDVLPICRWKERQPERMMDDQHLERERERDRNDPHKCVHPAVQAVE